MPETGAEEIERRTEERIWDVLDGEGGRTYRYTRAAAPMRLTLVNGVPIIDNGAITVVSRRFRRTGTEHTARHRRRVSGMAAKAEVGFEALPQSFVPHSRSATNVDLARRRKQGNREKIHAAAMEMSSTNGYSPVSIEAVTATGGLNRVHHGKTE